jgi:hypothetical protein
MKLPSYVKHIKRPEAGDKKTWCGKTVGFGEAGGFYFTGLDHAAANALKEGRLLACPECVDAAMGALDKGTWNEPYPHHDRVQQICRELHKKHAMSSKFAVDDPLYKELVELGEEAVPALLHRLDQFDAPWDGLAIWEPLVALHDITGVTVHNGESAGKLKELIKLWLDWGEGQGHYERIEWDD